ncbi:MAG: C40 family peptidase, partial [Acidobacteria bacterium]|nr:C40 family peptidase [Acidobacteriota bacterium]
MVALILLPVLGCVSAARRGLPRPAPEMPRPLPERAPSPAGQGVGSATLELARSLIGSAYRYGGASPAGFDCSGLALYVFERDGVALPRITREQADYGFWVPLDELAPGDLVFFSEPGAAPHHVGIVASKPGEPLRMIHASASAGVVETAVLSSAYWLRRLRFGRRVRRSARVEGEQS